MKKIKNNKGFSLVELIVVVLIMAIIAVALAPQVMKWVNNARISTDRQTIDAVVSYAQLALTDKDAYAEVTKDGATAVSIAINTSGITVTSDSAGKFEDAFNAAAGITASSDIKFKTTNASVTINVTSDGVVQKPDLTDTVLESDDLDD